MAQSSDQGLHTVLAPVDFSFTRPSKGDQSRGVMRLSDLLTQFRANVWRMPPGSQGRRHRERTQEEIFVALRGDSTLLLGDPAEAIELSCGALAIIRPGTAVQLVNVGVNDAIVLVVGAPPTVGDAEYLT